MFFTVCPPSPFATNQLHVNERTLVESLKCIDIVITDLDLDASLNKISCLENGSIKNDSAESWLSLRGCIAHIYYYKHD